MNRRLITGDSAWRRREDGINDRDQAAELGSHPLWSFNPALCGPTCWVAHVERKERTEGNCKNGNFNFLQQRKRLVNNEMVC